MTETLTVRDFGPIVEANLILKKQMVFIGQQASGKSTLAKLLAIFRNVDFVLRKEEIPFLDYFLDYNISNYFKENTFFEYKCPDYTVTYSFKYLDVVLTDSFKTHVEDEKKRVEAMLKSLINANENLKSQLNNDEFLKQIYDANWKNISNILKEQVYIPAERILVSIANEAPFTVGSLALPTCLKDFLMKFELARNQLKQMHVGILPVTYKYEKNINKIYLNDKHSILLSEAASGIQSIIPVQLVINHLISINRLYSFIVEEPELNLYPTAQKAIIQFLIDKSNSKADDDLILTTHSPYVLTVLNNLLFAYSTQEKHPKKSEKVNSIINKSIHINPKNFNAYYMFEGRSQQIFDEKLGLISENELDDISEDLQGEYDSLMDIYREK